MEMARKFSSILHKFATTYFFVMVQFKKVVEKRTIYSLKKIKVPCYRLQVQPIHNVFFR